MRSRFILLLLFLLATNLLKSQEYGESYFKFKSETTTKITFPFETVNDLIIIKASINNSGSFNFIIDSGVRTTLITALEPQQTLEVNTARIIEVNGLGNGEPIAAYYSTENTIEIGDIIGKNQNLIILLSDIFHLQPKLGMPIHGIIGYDLLKDFVIRIDYLNQQITFFKPDKFKYKKSMGEVIPLTIFNKKPYLMAQIENCSHKEHSVRLLIDTGGSMPIWLFADSTLGICKPVKTVEASLGAGLNGSIKGQIGRITSFTLGNYTFKEPICNFPDSASVYKVVEVDKRSGSVGAEVLRRFIFYLDYTNEQFIIKKNAHFNTQFEYDMSGLEFEKPISNLPIYVISSVRKNSEAEMADLREGDQLLFINGMKSTQLTLDQLHLILQTKENKKIKITILRDGIEEKKVFRLHRII